MSNKLIYFSRKKISFSPPGFIGPWCHSHLCDHVKCQNGGTCIPTPHGAQCQCPPDFKGPFCQDYACKGYCQHGGTPNGQLQSSGHYQCNCDCPPGTSGLHCEKDSCSTLQCFHGGHCTILGGREICNCTLGKKKKNKAFYSIFHIFFPILYCLFSFIEYAGLRCMEVIQENPCKIVHCKNGGVCQAVRSSDTKSYHSKCICPTNRAGLECERPNLCLNFCQNGGSCVSDHEGQVSCICPPGLGGSR